MINVAISSDSTKKEHEKIQRGLKEELDKMATVVNVVIGVGIMQ